MLFRYRQVLPPLERFTYDSQTPFCNLPTTPPTDHFPSAKFRLNPQPRSGLSIAKGQNAAVDETNGVSGPRMAVFRVRAQSLCHFFPLSLAREPFKSI